jgi:hypothetical protein
LSPSIDTPLGSWHYCSSNVNLNLLTVSFPAGSTIDILFEVIPRTTTSTSSTYTRSLSGAVAGVRYAAPILTNMLPQVVRYL